MGSRCQATVGRAGVTHTGTPTGPEAQLQARMSEASPHSAGSGNANESTNCHQRRGRGPGQRATQ